MKANKEKVCLAMARGCMSFHELVKKSGIPESSVKNVYSGRGVKPSTFGKVARALGVDPEEILEKEE